jgi:hypothetical protein
MYYLADQGSFWESPHRQSALLAILVQKSQVRLAVSIRLEHVRAAVPAGSHDGETSEPRLAPHGSCGKGSQYLPEDRMFRSLSRKLPGNCRGNLKQSRFGSVLSEDRSSLRASCGFSGVGPIG